MITSEDLHSGRYLKEVKPRLCGAPPAVVTWCFAAKCLSRAPSSAKNWPSSGNEISASAGSVGRHSQPVGCRLPPPEPSRNPIARSPAPAKSFSSGSIRKAFCQSLHKMSNYIILRIKFGGVTLIKIRSWSWSKRIPWFCKRQKKKLWILWIDLIQ